MIFNTELKMLILTSRNISQIKSGNVSWKVQVYHQKIGKKKQKIWFLFQEGFISLTVVEPESHLLKAFLLLTVMLYNANLHL